MASLWQLCAPWRWSRFLTFTTEIKFITHLILSLWALYSIVVPECKLRTLLKVSLILAVTGPSHAVLFQILRMSSWNLMETTAPQISSPTMNCSPSRARTRFSQQRDARPKVRLRDQTRWLHFYLFSTGRSTCHQTCWPRPPTWVWSPSWTGGSRCDSRGPPASPGDCRATRTARRCRTFLSTWDSGRNCGSACPGSSDCTRGNTAIADDDDPRGWQLGRKLSAPPTSTLSVIFVLKLRTLRSRPPAAGWSGCWPTPRYHCRHCRELQTCCWTCFLS